MEKEQNNRMEEMEQIDLILLLDDLWRGIKRFWMWLLLLIAVCAVGNIGLQYVRYQPQYEAYSTFFVDTQNAYVTGETYYSQTTAEQLSKSFPYIMTSGTLQDMVAKTLGVDNVPATISASSLADSALFTLKVTANDPQTAYDVLQAVIEDYPQVARYIIGDTKLTLMDESGVPQRPINEINNVRSLLMGAAGGAVAGLLLLVVYGITRKTVRREDDLKAYVSVPHLGSMPKIKVKKRSGKAQILMDTKNSNAMLSESVRVLRNRVMKQAEEENWKTFTITSTQVGEGKTTVAVNLALALAKKEKKVLLLDGDLRSPAAADALGLTKSAVTVSDVLRGAEMPSEEQLSRYENTSLYVLTGSVGEKNDSDLLKDQQIQDMLTKACEEFDYILIDTPPCGVLSDALQFARFTDCAIMVVRQDFARIDRVVSAMQLLADTGVTLLGYTVNQAELGITGSGYGYYGYGGYGYGRRYGYGKYGYGYGYRYGGEAKQKQ